MKLHLVLLSLIMLTCCWGPSEFTLLMKLQQDDHMDKTLQGNYLIKELGKSDVSIYNLNMTFTTNSNQVFGYSGCNRFFGNFSITGNNIVFRHLGMTKMICNDESNRIEKKLFDILQDVNVLLFSENGVSFAKNKTILLRATKEMQEDSLRIEYAASSRGFYKHIVITQKTISTETKRGENALIKACSSSDWERLTQALQEIDLAAIPDLDPPSKHHQFDAAAVARLTVKTKGKTYKTQTFDDGNPPKEIAKLVKEILSISENIE
ncbi:META domain-containing protein [Aestuariivivens sediminis]|uniref:META domain-containing protein n=1 Tax=Aestuariivivens sediminis TaxID=2913557 RepID=UPI001F56790D|nr:META domain-containing protein [Aestuariivivens sediminis]